MDPIKQAESLGAGLHHDREHGHYWMCPGVGTGESTQAFPTELESATDFLAVHAEQVCVGSVVAEQAVDPSAKLLVADHLAPVRLVNDAPGDLAERFAALGGSVYRDGGWHWAHTGCHVKSGREYLTAEDAATAGLTVVCGWITDLIGFPATLDQPPAVWS
jgi:hypothetical protein